MWLQIPVCAIYELKVNCFLQIYGLEVNTCNYIIKHITRILSFWLVQNLSYLFSASFHSEEGFLTSRNDRP